MTPVNNIALVIIIAFLFTACVASPATRSSTFTPSPIRTLTQTLVRTQPALIARPAHNPSARSDAHTAAMAETFNTVLSRHSADHQRDEAVVGQALPQGGQVRLDPVPSTIVRDGPNAHFTITELSGAENDPVARPNLLTGELWVLLNSGLNRGSSEVEPTVGSTSTGGSYLSVDYDPTSSSLVVACLEGNCGLRNEFGLTNLQTGQETSISPRGLPPELPQPMQPVRLERWRKLACEARRFMDPIRTHLAPPWLGPGFIVTHAAPLTAIPCPRDESPGLLETIIAERTHIMGRTRLIEHTQLPTRPPLLSTPLPLVPTPLPSPLTLSLPPGIRS